MSKRTGYTKRDIENIRVAVGLNLRAARKNAGMSQSDVMQALWGVSNNRNRISEIENGNKDLSLIDLLVFQRLYGQSIDYICGLSVEPEIDMLAGTVNHVVNQSQALIEMLTGQLAGVMVNHIKPMCKNDHEALLASAKALCGVIRREHEHGAIASQTLIESTRHVMNVVRDIEVKQARQVQAVDTQMTQISDRIDKDDRHVLLKDIDKHYQYSLPLPAASLLDDDIVIGVCHDR